MMTGLPTVRSALNKRPLQDIYDEIRDVYKRYPQPWVIGYSGGKDSTTVLQLVWNAIRGLPPEERQKPIFVIASDTRVETPVIVDYIDNTLRCVNEVAQAEGMPFSSEKRIASRKNRFIPRDAQRATPFKQSGSRWFFVAPKASALKWHFS